MRFTQTGVDKVSFLKFLFATCWPMLLISGCSGSEHDGEWQVTLLNGQSAGNQRFTISVNDGRVSGGFDGCNAWGRDSDHSDMIVTDLKECPRDVASDVYSRVAMPVTPPRFRTSGETITLERGSDKIVASSVGGK
jgi:hypothetical protein